MTIIKEYNKFINLINESTKKIESIHKKNIICHKRCDSCCINLTIFPIEFFAIKEKMVQNNFELSKVRFDNKASCGFLKNSICQIYDYRPLICRTHGLPIVFLNQNDDGSEEWNVTFCDKNFTSKATEEIIFDNTNTLNLAETNSKLFSLNQQFLHETKSSDEITDRIELKELLK